MKQVLLFAGALLLHFTLAAQAVSGRIVYQETIKLMIEIDGADEAMRNLIPPTQSYAKTLVFTEREAIYQDGEKPGGDVEIKHEENGADMQIVIKRPLNTLYTDMANNATLNAREFFGREFLITGAPKDYVWKLTGEQKKIGEYSCFKALLQDTSQQVAAWFTPQIPLGIGPAGWGKLPGMILAVDIDNGQRTIVATSVQLGAVAEGEMVKPAKGRAVTQAEFDAIEAAKLKEMGELQGGNGRGVRMIIREERN